MPRPDRGVKTSDTDVGMAIQAPFLARLIFRSTVRAVDVGRDAIIITYRRACEELPRTDVRALAPLPGLFWDSLRIDTTDRRHVVHGLPSGSATVLSQIWVTLGLVERVRAAVAMFRHLLERDAYLNHSAVLAWRATYDLLCEGLPACAEALPLNPPLKELIREYRRYHADCERIAIGRNDSFVARKRGEYSSWFAQAGGNSGLSEEQQDAILHDEDNCLVVAGAGTGKTNTVVGKVGYLVRTGTPTEEILLLAFTRKAAEEAGERLERAVGRSVPAKTFHALGLEIVAAAEGRQPSVSSLAGDDHAFSRALTRYLDELLDAPESREPLIDFFVRFRYPYRSPFEFDTRDHYLRTLRAYDLRTLQGEQVKSHEELMIADWLYRNGVRYLYEHQYEHDTATIRFRQYKPDFFLPDLGIYLEHFGVSRTGETAPGIDPSRYREQMEWKRQTHRKYGTTLLETYSWQRMENRLYEVLHEHMRAVGVILQPRAPEEIVRTIRTQRFVQPVAKLLGTFLSLYKSNAWTEAEVMAASAAHGQSRDTLRDAAFLHVFRLVYARYQMELNNARELDFHDMIAAATHYVENGKYRSRFKHVIVDECQDFSRGRARLLRALLSQVPDRRLFCGGDDWQSIYRFNGSDIAQMTRFADEFGFTKRCDLTRSYRLAEELLEVSSGFVQRNPAQLRKTLTSNRALTRPGLSMRIVPSEQQEASVLATVIDEIAAERSHASVLVLGRYKHTLPQEQERLSIELGHPSMNFRWLTVHSAKGLEADYAVILDMASAKFGFPAEIADDPLLDLVLATSGGYPNAEERRLFYVGITRARERCFLLVPDANPSRFIDELLSMHGAAIDGPVIGVLGAPQCQECGGRLVLRRGPYGAFWGCGNFPTCEGKARQCPTCATGAMIPTPHGFICSKAECGKT